MATIDDLKQWIERDLTRFGESKNHLEVKLEPSAAVGGDQYEAVIYTETNSYYISARNSLGGDQDQGYLGCVASCRKPRAGEDWTRGNDLSDGPLSKRTWRSILGDIVSYEMVKVHFPKPDFPIVHTGLS